MKQQVKETKDIIKTLKEAGKVFDVDYTSLTRIVYYNGREYAYYDTFLPMHEIYFLNMVKKQVPETLPDVKRKDIIYMFTDILKKNKNKSGA